jgi:hypothetical protein
MGPRREAYCRRDAKEAQGASGKDSMVLHGLAVKRRYKIIPLDVFLVSENLVVYFSGTLVYKERNGIAEHIR